MLGVLALLILLVFLNSLIKPSNYALAQITPIPTKIPTFTPTPTPTSTPTSWFTSPLYCPQIFLEGVTPCADRNKTPVACSALFHPDGSPVINFICGIPGNPSSPRPCVNYSNNPNLVICP